jgi:hypothetical protein
MKTLPVDNSQFKAWFGKSLVKDAQGNPLRVYHGSNKGEDFSVFKSILNYGFYFTPDPEYAGSYSGTTTGSNIIPVYLKLEHPMDFYAFRDLVRAARVERVNPLIKAKQLGYDGVITSKKHEFGWDDSWGKINYDPITYIVFSPNQIKSAISNKGTYNPEDERITESTDYCQVSSDSLVNKVVFPLTVYRGIEVANKEDIDLNELGTCWTTEKDAAIAYWSEGLVDPYIVTAQILDKNDVDWYSTLKARKRYPDEEEITIKDTTKVKVISIQTEFEMNESTQLFSCLKESKAFRNEQMMEKYSTKELGEIFFAMMLTLHNLGPREEVKRYCIKTLKFPKFDHIFLSSTDLANVITTLRNAKELLGQPNIDIPVNELKRYLRGVVLGNNTPAFNRALFFRLQTRLRIKDSQLLSLRRNLVDGEGHGDDLSYGKPLYEYLRRYQNKCDLLVILQGLLDEKDS